MMHDGPDASAPSALRSRPGYRVAKRLMDLTVASAALLVLAVPLLVVAMAIKIDSPGPVFFRQRRLGLAGRPFRIFKFRTMFVGAPVVYNADGSTFNAADDPRVTRVGRWLRSTSIDELPQLLNVLSGQLSLVGPRPDHVEMLAQYRPEDMKRLQVKPGITGIAAVEVRQSEPWRDRLRYDMHYVDRCSVWLDIRILLKTVPVVLMKRNVFMAESWSQRSDGRG
jgi:undecaprenyl phosphate N,N'-diacetylbacillosamine 1-phosphate transferase